VSELLQYDEALSDNKSLFEKSKVKFIPKKMKILIFCLVFCLLFSFFFCCDLF
jgi:hypothetical protein